MVGILLVQNFRLMQEEIFKRMIYLLEFFWVILAYHDLLQVCLLLMQPEQLLLPLVGLLVPKAEPFDGILIMLISVILFFINGINDHLKS
jgi:hypothetical protein